MNILDIAIAKKLAGGGGGSGTDNYNDLSNLPKINDTTLSGNKSSSALGLQSEINSDSKLASDLVDDTNQDNKFVTSTEKNTWNAKQNAIDSDHKLSSDLVDDANKTNKFVTSTEKQTWNAKQNAIDADHKLSSSLVSFTEAEDAALASGINSSKVGQISTNQTNILYALGKTGKNLFNSSDTFTTPTGLTITKNADGSFTVSGTSTTAVNVNLGTITLDATKTYVLSGCPTGGDANTYSLLFGITGYYTKRDTGTGITLTNAPANTSLTLYISIGANYAVNKTFYPMICTAEDWTIGHDYVPYALPNPMLTAALVEQVDEGAKNLLEIPASQTVRNSTFTKDADDWVTSDASTDYASWTVANSNVSLNLKAGTYIVVAIPHANNTATCEFSIMDSNSTEITRAGINYGQQETVTVREFTINSATTVYIMYKLTTQKCRFMICTKAKYDISPNYESHVLPNTDLTQEVNALHERTDQIQPVVKFEADVSGWYRVFTLGSTNSVAAVGAYDNSCDIVIKRLFAHTNNEHHEIKLASIFENMGFTDEFSKSAVLLITNIRYVSTNNSAYIDIYYSGSAMNTMICSVNNNAGVASWEAVNTVSRVPETTTGETVWASHDFNGNYDPAYLAAKTNFANIATTETESLYSDLTVTVPPFTAYRITAFLNYNDTAPKTITLSTSDNPSDYAGRYLLSTATNRSSELLGQLVTSSVVIATGNSSKNVYVWASSLSAGNNRIYVMVEKMAKF